MAGTPIRIVKTSYVAGTAGAQQAQIFTVTAQAGKKLALVGLRIVDRDAAAATHQYIRLHIIPDEGQAYDPDGYPVGALQTGGQPIGCEYIAEKNIQIQYTNTDGANAHPFDILAVFENREK